MINRSSLSPPCVLAIRTMCMQEACQTGFWGKVGKIRGRDVPERDGFPNWFTKKEPPRRNGRSGGRWISG